MSEPRGPRSLREYLDRLRSAGELHQIDVPVDPHLELAEIHRRVIAADGPALLFRRVKGSDHAVVTNLFGSARRLELAIAARPEQVLADAVRLAQEAVPPRLGDLWRARGLLRRLLRVGTRGVRRAPVTACCQDPAQLSRLPFTTSWSEDGGAFLTLPLVYTEPPGGGPPNLGIYRMQRFDDGRTGMHWQIGKGGGFHYAQAEALDQALPVSVFLGGPPAALIGALTPLPENVPELLMASLLLGEKVPRVRVAGAPHPLLAEAEFCLVGEVAPQVRHPEGPFGDHYGYYSLQHDFPVFTCHRVYHRPDAILPATVVGKPRQEDFYLGDFLQDLLSPLFPLAMPAVEELWSYGETGYHALAAARVKERYRREAMASAFRVLGEGQLSLTKFLLVTDRPVPLRDFRRLLIHLLERTNPETDLYVFANLSMDSLDYAGPRLHEGSKGVWLGLGDPVRTLPGEFQGPLPEGIRRAEVFCPGCLVLEPDEKAPEDLPRRVARSGALADWPLVVLQDEARRAVASTMNFLWTTFTRFDPASDLHSAEPRLIANHVAHSLPVVLDARMKDGYPDELFCDPATERLVERRWTEYFPAGQEMGDSTQGHLELPRS